MTSLTNRSFDAQRNGTGTAEWAEVTENIQIGCSNNCLYCYAAHKAATMYGGWCKREDWPSERLTKRAEMKSYPARDGVVMFPSTHDITPFNLEAYIRVARLILQKGNRLLIVSKPHLECISPLMEDLNRFKKQILFRFTIGSMNDATCYFWEPGAPDPQERVACLTEAYNSGFQTSVSIEPMLAGVDSTSHVIDTVHDFVSETIWIGKMNKARLRVDMSKPENAAAVYNIEGLQSDAEILRLYRYFKDAPYVRWKDSIKQVLANYGLEVPER